MRRLTNFKETVQAIRKIRNTDGIKAIRLVRIGEPKGAFFPTSRVSLIIEARRGPSAHVEPEVPVPWPIAWGLRAARRFRIPGLKRIRPERIHLRLPIPGS